VQESAAKKLVKPSVKMDEMVCFVCEAVWCTRVQTSAPAQHVPTRTHELLSRAASGGSLTVAVRYSRTPSIYAVSMVTCELQLTNHSTNACVDLRLVDTVRPICSTNCCTCMHVQKCESGMSVAGFNRITLSANGGSQTMTLGVDFADTTQV
jgi:hypothetical protein